MKAVLPRSQFEAGTNDLQQPPTVTVVELLSTRPPPGYVLVK
jgi:hypothetical protein